VPALAGRQHELGLLELAEQLLRRARELQRLPDLTRNLALQSRRVREHAADRQGAARRHRQVLVECVLEVELAGRAQLHHRHRGERLRDRPDAVLVLRRRLLAALDVGETDRVGPNELAVAHDGGGDRRNTLLRLRLGDRAAECRRKAIRRGQGFRAPVEWRRSRRRCRRRRCRDA
jgi:hypothetical protein